MMKDLQNSVSEKDVFQMLDDTSRLLAKENANYLSSALIGAKNSNALTNNVEFWQWMQRNYSSSGIFDSTSSMQRYIAQGVGKENWMIKQLQGKGYEWDWMTAQRNNPLNAFNMYDAGDVANRAASDVTARNILSGSSQEYQMKAYISKSNPDLHNTPKEMAVVTNAEKVNAVRSNGYENVEGFQNAETIKKSTNRHMDQIKKGRATPNYSFKNVAGTMAKSGAIGCAIGVGIETIASYKSWKSGHLTDEEYLTEILKAGGDSGVTAGATAGIMIPVSAAVTAAGISTLVTIPIALYFGDVINKIVAPYFGRGKKAAYIAQAKYYKNITKKEKALRKDMEKCIALYLDEYAKCFELAFTNIEESFKKGDADGVIAGANQITKKLGGKVHYETVDEFKSFLDDDSQDFIL